MSNCAPLFNSSHQYLLSPRDVHRRFQNFGFSPLKLKTCDDLKPRSSKNGINRSISSNPSSDLSSSAEFSEIRSGNAKSVSSKRGARNDEQEKGSEGGEGEVSVPSSFDFLELKRELDRVEEEEEDEEKEDGSGDEERKDTENSEVEEIACPAERRVCRQVVRRSSLLAKQVISIQSARSLGFVSQLWVDTRSWMVVLVEVRPNLLSGEMEKFLLEDITQVGDVVLVEDDDIIRNDLKMLGLDTLVGYDVVSSGRRKFGKVRGYTFNINSGAVESLELDSFGFSIIPSSLVSTYCLFVEDVLEVVSDTIVVDEYAAPRVQRLTKGILDSRSVEQPSDDALEYFEYGRKTKPFANRTGQRKPNRRRIRRRETNENWELPMDYY